MSPKGRRSALSKNKEAKKFTPGVGEAHWMATAITVFSRLWIWGELSINRDRSLIDGLMAKVRAAAVKGQAILFAVDGLAAYPKSILITFSDQYYSGKPRRPPLIPWQDIHLVRVIKTRRGKKLKNICRSVAYGCRNRVFDLIAMSQISSFQINSALRLPLGDGIYRTTECHFSSTYVCFSSSHSWFGSYLPTS